MIQYRETLDGISAEHLHGGFFEGWGNPPSPDAHFKLLQGSAAVILAWDDEAGQVVGFINAFSDGVLMAFIPLLEVLPAYRKQGIGAELVRRMLDKLRQMYTIDLICDAGLQPFYARFGMQPYTAMIYRNYDRQAGD